MRYTSPKFYMCRGVRITAAEFEAWYAAQPKRPVVPQEVAATFVGYLRYRTDEAALDLADSLEQEEVVIGWAQDLIDFADDHPGLTQVFAPEEERETKRPGMELYWDWKFDKRRAFGEVSS